MRVVYDDIGCMLSLPSKYSKKLKSLGINATPFSRLKGQANSEFNNRSHRKIAVIDGKIAYTAYVYDGEAWKAMDGNYSADNVYFDADLTYTANIGTKTVPASGSGKISAKGKNVKQVLSDILALEKNPNKTAPAVSFSAQGGFGTFEIGTKKWMLEKYGGD